MLTEGNLQGVQLIPLKKIEDDRGAVMHMLRADLPHFQKFGEVYFSLIHPGVVKGWKLHKEIHQNLAVPEGKVRLVLFDPRKDSKTFGQVQTIDFGSNNYQLVQVPPNIWYAFKAISETHAIMCNCATAPHSPAESETLPLQTELIPYRWS